MSLDGARLFAGLLEMALVLLHELLRVVLEFLRALHGLADRPLPALEGVQERAPRELPQNGQQDQKRHDGPDRKPRIRIEEASGEKWHLRGPRNEHRCSLFLG
jgi:hypothetical protein